MPLNWYLSRNFSLGVWLLGRKATEIKCHSPHVILRVTAINPVDVDLD